jgi:hypothetical protein
LLKGESSLLRATAKAAFNLLEGYINGVGYDVLLTRRTTTRELELIQEWDASRGRPRQLTLRDKLLKYPRLALQRQHAPVDENRCSAIGEVISMEKSIRHALIHPTPRLARSEADSDREHSFRSLTPSVVGTLCDSVIEVVLTVDEALEGVFGTVGHWLFRRNRAGRFDDSVFD